MQRTVTEAAARWAERIRALQGVAAAGQPPAAPMPSPQPAAPVLRHEEAVELAPAPTPVPTTAPAEEPVPEPAAGQPAEPASPPKPAALALLSATPRELRGRRLHAARARTVNTSRISQKSLREGAEEYPEQPGVDYQRPRTRADCANVPRPCPYVSCAHHTYLDVNPNNGSIKVHRPDIEVWELDEEESCVLDVVEHHPDGAVLEQVGALMNITRERIRQIEARTFKRVKRLDRISRGAIHNLLDHGQRHAPSAKQAMQPKNNETTDEEGEEER